MQAEIMQLSDVASGTASLGGSEVILEVQPNFYFALTDVDVDDVPARTGEAPAFAALSILLDGYVKTNVCGMEALEPNSLFVTSHGGGAELSSEFYGAKRLRNVEVFVTPRWFETADNPIAHDPAFDAIRRSLSGDGFYRRLPMQAALRECATRALDVSGTGGVVALRMEATALELLATLATTFVEREASPLLSRRDQDRVHAVREAIEMRPGEVFSISALAAEHGVSASKLKRDFFIAFSTCVGAFVVEQRLISARRLLSDGLTVSEAAYAVGYAHPSNFSTAFKRRFGVSPRSVRA